MNIKKKEREKKKKKTSSTTFNYSRNKYHLIETLLNSKKILPFVKKLINIYSTQMFPYVYSSVYIYVYISSINNTFKKKNKSHCFSRRKKTKIRKQLIQHSSA